MYSRSLENLNKRIMGDTSKKVMAQNSVLKEKRMKCFNNEGT